MQLSCGRLQFRTTGQESNCGQETFRECLLVSRKLNVSLEKASIVRFHQNFRFYQSPDVFTEPSVSFSRAKDEPLAILCEVISPTIHVFVAPTSIID
jgi:hypothetical protein